MHPPFADLASVVSFMMFSCFSIGNNCYLSSVQLLSRVQLSVTLWTVARQASLFSTNSRSLRKLMLIESVMPSNHLILCRPLLLLPSIFPSISVFSNESVLCIRWPGYWSLSFNISPSNEYSGLISFRMDWLALPVVPGTLKSLLQHHSSKASILWRSAFFMVQLSNSYMTTGKTIALTRQTFVSKVTSLLFPTPSLLLIRAFFTYWLRNYTLGFSTCPAFEVLGGLSLSCLAEQKLLEGRESNWVSLCLREGKIMN